jgi:hypothetical protein
MRPHKSFADGAGLYQEITDNTIRELESTPSA